MISLPYGTLSLWTLWQCIALTESIEASTQLRPSIPPYPICVQPQPLVHVLFAPLLPTTPPLLMLIPFPDYPLSASASAPDPQCLFHRHHPKARLRPTARKICRTLRSRRQLVPSLSRYNTEPPCRLYDPRTDINPGAELQNHLAARLISLL